MENGSYALRAIFKTPSAKKRVVVKNCLSILFVSFFLPPQALINPSAGRSFHFDFLIFRF